MRTMTCDTREQDLLLLVHGELSLPRRVAVRAHLRRCAGCRERYARLSQTSGLLAGAIRGPGSAPWSPALNRFRPPVSVWGHLLRAGLLSLAILTAALMTRTLLRRTAAPASCAAAHALAVKTPGCAPGLPSDKCR